MVLHVTNLLALTKHILPLVTCVKKPPNSFLVCKNKQCWTGKPCHPVDGTWNKQKRTFIVRIK